MVAASGTSGTSAAHTVSSVKKRVKRYLAYKIAAAYACADGISVFIRSFDRCARIDAVFLVKLYSGCGYYYARIGLFRCERCDGLAVGIAYGDIRTAA